MHPSDTPKATGQPNNAVSAIRQSATLSWTGPEIDGFPAGDNACKMFIATYKLVKRAVNVISLLPIFSPPNAGVYMAERVGGPTHPPTPANLTFKLLNLLYSTTLI